MGAEFIGGQPGSDEEDDDDDGDSPESVHPDAVLSHQELCNIILRFSARERLKKTGRHREQDKVFKRFYDNFKDVLEKAVRAAPAPTPFLDRVRVAPDRQAYVRQDLHALKGPTYIRAEGLEAPVVGSWEPWAAPSCCAHSHKAQGAAATQLSAPLAMALRSVQAPGALRPGFATVFRALLAPSALRAFMAHWTRVEG